MKSKVVARNPRAISVDSQVIARTLRVTMTNYQTIAHTLRAFSSYSQIIARMLQLQTRSSFFSSFEAHSQTIAIQCRLFILLNPLR